MAKPPRPQPHIVDVRIVDVRILFDALTDARDCAEHTAQAFGLPGDEAKMVVDAFVSEFFAHEGILNIEVPDDI